MRTKRFTTLSGLLLGLLLPTMASAQDGFLGRYELEGRYNNRRKTSVELQVTRLMDGGVRVSRTAKLTGRRFRSEPSFVWSSSDVRIEGRIMRVEFQVEAPGAEDGSAGLVEALDPDHSTPDAVIEALSQTNAFKAVYFLSRDQKSMSEAVLNSTRLGDEGWWRWVTAKGEREATLPQPGPLSEAEFLRMAHGKMEVAYVEHIEETYEDLLAEAEDGEERARLREQKEEDLDVSELGFMDDEYFEESVDERYRTGDEYLDERGELIPRRHVRVIMLGFSPAYAGVELNKTFVFDARTGSVIDEGEIEAY